MNIFRTRNNVIPYTVNKAITSNCYVSVDSGEVVVNAPWYFSRKQIQTIIEEKTAWISKKLKEYQEQNNTFTNKGNIFILGAVYQVKLYYKNVKAPSIDLGNRVVEVVLPNKFKKIETETILKILVEKLYNKIAESEIERAMEKTRLLLGFAPEDYKIERLNGNQIAMCNYDNKTITINPDIVRYDRKVIEYAVLHQFCHLKYRIHAKGFWKLVKTYMPNYEKYEKVLKDFSL